MLVIGAGPSGMDLAYEISKFAIKVTLSHHHKTDPLTQFPHNVNLKPDVTRLTETGAEFSDGSHHEYTVIFYCTGKTAKHLFSSGNSFTVFFCLLRLQIHFSIFKRRLWLIC